MNINVMYSSKTDEWSTPFEYFNEINKEFDFNLDPCADEFNHKCKKVFHKSTEWSFAKLGWVQSIL